MTNNLLDHCWTDLDSGELRIILDELIGGPGQYSDRSNNPNRFYLPLAGTSCRIVLVFREKKIVAIEPGPAFNEAEWDRIREEIEKSVLAGSMKVGRDYSFSSYRVLGFWRGQRSGVQILPPPDDAPRAPVEMAEHPFILEFPLRESGYWKVTNHRRMQEHRKLTLLLNVLLNGHTSLQPRRSEHFWAIVSHGESGPDIQWVQQFFYAKLDEAVMDELSPTANEQLLELDPEEYYANVGLDGKGLRVPADLDRLICLYQLLSGRNRAKFDRATFWMDMASSTWTIAVSSSFASLVSAVEALTERGAPHRSYCEECKRDRQHEEPGATESFRSFLEIYAPGGAEKSRRTKMYSLRSSILHGGELMQLDQDLVFGWDPPWREEHELLDDLWSLTQVALRNWLKDPRGQ